MSDVYPLEFDALTFTLEWLTAVTTGYSEEQRDILRDTPRLRWTGASTATANEARAISAAIEASPAGQTMLPDWRYARRVKPVSIGASSVLTVSTGGWPHEVGDVVAFTLAGAWETANITATAAGEITVDVDVTPFVHHAAWMLPLHVATLEGDLKVTPLGGELVTVAAEFIVPLYRNIPSLVVLPTWQGDPILDRRDIALGGTHGVVTQNDVFDAQRGPVTVNQVRKHERARGFYSMSAESSRQLSDVEGVLNTLQGRAITFWKPSWLPDYVPKGTSLSGQTALTAEPTIVDVPERADAVCIVFTDGEQHYYPVSSIVNGTNDTVLTLGTALTRSVTPDNVVTVSRMQQHRLDTDKVKFKVSSGMASSFSIPTLEVLK